jgi:hypothetical protein
LIDISHSFLAQRLAGLARKRVQVGEGAVDLGKDGFELVLGDRGIGAQGVEEGALAVELLQQVALQVRPARDSRISNMPVRHA